MNTKETRDMYLRLINKTEDYIEEHLGEVVLLRDVAANANLSEYHFHRIFSAFGTERLHEFIARIKLERSALFMLVNPALSVTEIAMLYGYSETSAYSRAFKRHFRITPSQFRKQAQDMSMNPVARFL